MKSYIFGFVTSILLTLVAYFAVVNNLFESNILIALILSLAVLQLIVQLIFFLHVLEGKPSEKGWRVIIFFSTISIILVIMIGSLWIMNNLNYHMTPQQMNQYILDQDGF
jgi:cytochrome o ubiquinol oxidase operon protein cyoD